MLFNSLYFKIIQNVVFSHKNQQNNLANISFRWYDDSIYTPKNKRNFIPHSSGCDISAFILIYKRARRLKDYT